MKIGITCGFNKDENKIMLNKSYIDFINKGTGGVNHVHILYPTEYVSEEFIKDFNLIIASGGPDINPIMYGQPTIDANECDFERDEFELKLLNIAYINKIPTLGICRGAQLMGVYLGAKLKQHVENHSQPHKREVPSHPIVLNRLGKEILHTAEECWVNSMHHQCINIGVNLKQIDNFVNSYDNISKDKIIVTGVANDGICEMFIAKEFRKFLGVQWHEEELSKYSYGHSEAIFNYLLKE